MSSQLTKTLSLNEAAALLTAKLGALRAWYPFLSDCIRDTQNINGYQLKPCCCMKDMNGHYRPRYAVGAVTDFASMVVASTMPGEVKPAKPIDLFVDADCYWL